MWGPGSFSWGSVAASCLDHVNKNQACTPETESALQHPSRWRYSSGRTSAGSSHVLLSHVPGPQPSRSTAAWKHQRGRCVEDTGRTRDTDEKGEDRVRSGARVSRHHLVEGQTGRVPAHRGLTVLREGTYEEFSGGCWTVFKIGLGFHKNLGSFYYGNKLQFLENIGGGASDFPAHMPQSCSFPLTMNVWVWVSCKY